MEINFSFLFFRQVRSAEQLLTEMARMQPPPHELDIQMGAIYTKVQLHRGHKFGPYRTEWTEKPMDKHFALEVSVSCVRMMPVNAYAIRKVQWARKWIQISCVRACEWF